MGRQDGLLWQRTTDTIRAFVSKNGASTPRRALMCTYDFDLLRFEAVLLPEMTRRGRQFRTLVMADAGALQAHLQSTGVHRFARYQVAPIRCHGSGVFHPKIMLLAAGERYLVGVGSANLTAGGLGGNLELMQFLTAETQDGKRLLGGAAAFFDELIESKAIDIPVSGQEFVRVALAGVRREPGALVHSLNLALLPQMSSLVRSARIGPTQEVMVLSPWHSAVESIPGTESALIHRIKSAFGGGVALYTEGEGGRGPNLGRGVKVHVRSEQRAIDEDDSDAPLDRRPTRVHAKAYLVRAERGSVLFFGSANCTGAALARPVPRGGNVEVIVPSRLSEQQDASLRADLAELFAPATGRVSLKPESRRGEARGSVLCGQVIQTRSGTVLELEVPGRVSGRVVVAYRPHGDRVPVAVRKGAGSVRKVAELQRLFPDEAPARSANSWGAVLWERWRSEWIPFPVSLPLIGAGGVSPDEALADLLFEEAGFWPSEKSSDSAPDAETDMEEVDEDVETVTEARHQGELDRLAVVLAVLRRRIYSGGAPPDYIRERLEFLRRRVARLDVPSHVRRVLLNYLNGSRHRFAK